MATRLGEPFLERACVGRVRVHVRMRVCAQSRSLSPSPPEQPGRPGSLGPSQVTPFHPLASMQMCLVGWWGRKGRCFGFYLKIFSEGEFQETGAALPQKESRLGWGGCLRTRERWKTVPVLLEGTRYPQTRGLSPAHPVPLEAAPTRWPEVLPSFGLTLSLLFVRRLERRRSLNLPFGLGIGGNSLSGSQSCV